MHIYKVYLYVQVFIRREQHVPWFAGLVKRKHTQILSPDCSIILKKQVWNPRIVPSLHQVTNIHEASSWETIDQQTSSHLALSFLHLLPLLEARCLFCLQACQVFERLLRKVSR